MRLGLPFIAGVALSLMAGGALACSPVLDERPLFLVKAHSKPVTADSQCRTINIGVDDDIFLEPAVDLGNGRVMQVVGRNNWTPDGVEPTIDKTHVLIGDCYNREATLLRGPEISSEPTGCGVDVTYADLVGAKAVMPLDVGEDLDELGDLVEAKGGDELSPSEYFFNFNKVWEFERHPVSKKDRFDLLCGCKVFYPNTSGGMN